MYTVFEIEGRRGGAQSYIANEINEILQIDYQKDKKEGDKIICKVSMHEGKIGHPYCNNVKVVAEVVRGLRKGKKITIFKKKAKKRYEVKKGHRQPYTWIKIIEVNESADN